MIRFDFVFWCYCLIEASNAIASSTTERSCLIQRLQAERHAFTVTLSACWLSSNRVGRPAFSDDKPVYVSEFVTVHRALLAPPSLPIRSQLRRSISRCHDDRDVSRRSLFHWLQQNDAGPDRNHTARARCVNDRTPRYKRLHQEISDSTTMWLHVKKNIFANDWLTDWLTGLLRCIKRGSVPRQIGLSTAKIAYM